MALPRFEKSFTQPLPIPGSGIRAAAGVMRSSRLHRYTKRGAEEGEAKALEREVALWQGARFCLAVTSGRQAMQIALRAAGVKPGDAVPSNAFTLAPVPVAIATVGGRPVPVEVTEDIVSDPDDVAGPFDMRLPPTFPLSDRELLAELIAGAVASLQLRRAA